MNEWNSPTCDEKGRVDLRSEWYAEFNEYAASINRPPRIYWVGMVLSAIWLVGYLIIYPSIPMVTSHGHWQGIGMPGGCRPWTAICEMQRAEDELNEIRRNTPSRQREKSTGELAASVADAELRLLERQSVYFDFDTSAIRPEYQETIKHQAEYLRAHKNNIVTLVGDTDEQGSAEISLALGMFYAHAVEKRLIKLGAAPKQIKTQSMGREQPRALCHEEKCWKENRRVDFVHVLH
jgi:peptidoglycan-associated lipoprotein